MKNLHKAQIRVFVKPQDFYDEIKKSFSTLLNLDLKKEKINLEEYKATGFEKKEIKILYVTIEKNRQLNTFFDNLKEKVGKQKLLELVNNVDDDCYLHIRLDKEKLLVDEWEIIEGGNCFHIAILIATYPKNSEKAKEKLLDMINS